MKIANTDRNFNEIFRKDVNYDNIKSHKKTEFQYLFRRYIFQKTTQGIKLTPQFFMINREAAKISALLSGKSDKYEYFTGEEILSPD